MSQILILPLVTSLQVDSFSRKRLAGFLKKGVNPYKTKVGVIYFLIKKCKVTVRIPLIVR